MEYIYFYQENDECDKIILSFFKKKFNNNFKIITDGNFTPEVGKVYRFFNNSQFGPINNDKFVTLKNRSVISTSPIHFFMMYYDEDIFPDYGVYHEFMTFIHLNPPTVYFESEGFRKITSVPESPYIAVITPSLFKKTKLTVPDVLKKVSSSKSNIIPLLPDNKDLLEQAVQSHGNTFKTIWKWLELPTSRKKAFYSNLWVMKRETFLMYLTKVRQIMERLDNAPDNIKCLLQSNANYNGKLSAKELYDRTGYPYYTYHPFILERVACTLVD